VNSALEIMSLVVSVMSKVVCFKCLVKVFHMPLVLMCCVLRQEAGQYGDAGAAAACAAVL